MVVTLANKSDINSMKEDYNQMVWSVLLGNPLSLTHQIQPVIQLNI